LMLLLGVAATGIGGVAIAYAIGRPVVELLFGPDSGLPAGTTAIIALASVLALGTLLLTIVMISRARPKVVGWVWAFALGVGVLWIAVGSGSQVDRVVWSFLIAEATAFVSMFLAELRFDAQPAISTVPFVS